MNHLGASRFGGRRGVFGSGGSGACVPAFYLAS